jgi:hypothetical protein
MWSGRFRLELAAMPKLTTPRWIIDGLDVMPKLTRPQWIIASLGTMALFILVALATAPR